MNLLEGLNEQQKEAVQHIGGPALVVAGAGTGKTTVITRRIAYLVEQKLARPDEILALTFTDKAASEMEQRVDLLLPLGYVNTNIMTFHALGDQILRDNGLEIGLRSDFRVMSHFAQVVYMREILRRSKLKYFAPLGSPFRFVDGLLGHFSRLKDESISPQRYFDYAKLQTGDDADRTLELATLYDEYVRSCRADGQLDFGDQIVLATELLARRTNIAKGYRDAYKFILVDEYQDTNSAQANMLKMLINKQHNIMVVGDDDQSIYRFRGAAFSNILEFQTQFSDTRQIILTRNYRSGQEILDSAYRLIQHNNPDRLEVKNNISKRLLAEAVGQKPTFEHFENIQKEHDWIARSIQSHLHAGLDGTQIAVLVRRNAQVKTLAQSLMRHGIASSATTPENLLQRPEVKGLIDFIAYLIDPKDSASLYRFLIGGYVGADVHRIQPLIAQARRSHTSLEEILREQNFELHGPIASYTELESYRDHIAELSVGQLLYKFISETGVLDQLVRLAEQSDEAALKVQNIARFFKFIKDFESVSDDVSVLSFAQYIAEIDDAGSELNAAESPLDDNAVRIMTVHRAKGLEFEVVYIAELVDQVFPSRRQADQLPLPADLVPIKSAADWHIQEERRLFYVALTRAKKQLTLTAAIDYGKARPKKVSPFVHETLPQAQLRTVSGAGLGLEHIDGFAKLPKTRVDLTSQLYRDGWLNLSAQQIDDYLRDPGQFWVFHVLNMPKGPFHSLVYGSAIHNAIELYNRAKLQQKPIKIAELLDAFEQSWRSEGFVSAEHELDRKARGRQVLRNFYRTQEQLDSWPCYVEQPFTLALSDLKVRISGRFDAVYDREGEIEIRDYKTSEVSGEVAAKRKLSSNNQLGIYALAWERIHEQAVTRVSLDFVDSEIVVSTEKIQHDKTMKKIEAVVEGIKNHAFTPKLHGLAGLEELS